MKFGDLVEYTDIPVGHVYSTGREVLLKADSGHFYTPQYGLLSSSVPSGERIYIGPWEDFCDIIKKQLEELK